MKDSFGISNVFRVSNLLDEEIDCLSGWQTRVFKHSKTGPDKTLLDVVLLTLDSEYKLSFRFPDPDAFERKYGHPYPSEYEGKFQPEKPFLTFQLAAQAPDGDIVAAHLKLEHSVSKKELLQWIHECLDRWGITWRGKKVIIGSHLSRMEIQHIRPLPKIAKYGDDSWECYLGRGVKIIDTLKLFGGASLEKATEGSPIPKHSLEGFKGHPGDYWRANPDRLFAIAEQEFWKYAETDVGALLWRLLDVRKFVWETWHIDLLRWRSTAGLSCRILQTRMTEALEPAVTQPYLSKNKQARTRVVFDPELIEARRLFLKSYQGGRREAYVQGFVPGPIYCFDFSKQYTTAALTIPLPTQSTRFERFASIDDCKTKVGVARVRWSFPPGMRPCIGLKVPSFPKLVFVRTGEGWTDVFTIRRALEKGAKVEFVDGWGFTPTEREKHHPIHEYFRELLDIGKQRGGFYEYLTKQLANGLVGRCVGKVDVDEDDDEDWKPHIKRVMASFAPIIACLILGRARSLEDRLIDLANDPIYSHTDSVFCRKPIDLEDPLVHEIRMAGGNINLEVVGPYAWVQRAAVCYVPNPDPKGKPKAAHHAIHCKKTDFIKLVETMLKNPTLKPGGFAEISYTTLGEYEKKRVPIDRYKISRMKANFDWDYKLRLKGPPLTGPDLWREMRETEVWESLEDLLANYKPGDISLLEGYKRLTGRIGRPSKLKPEDREKILTLYQKGLSAPKIARRLKLSRFAVHRFVRNSVLGIPHN